MFKLAASLGLKYFRSSKGAFVSFTSIMAVIGLTIGVAALIIVTSVMNGFEKELRDRILGVIPHVLIHSKEPISNYDLLIDQIEKNPDVEAAAPFIQSQALISIGNRSKGIVLTGIDVKKESQVSILPDNMLMGSLESLNDNEIILGYWLAAHLGTSVGDEVNITTSEMRSSLIGSFPRSFKFIVSGIFELKAEPDQNLALISHKSAQKIKGFKDETENIRLKVTDIMNSRVIGSDITLEISTQDNIYASSTWEKTHGTLFQAVQLEKLIIGILVFLIIGVAAFNVLCTTIMSVRSKEREIAILKTIGASDFTIVSIFIFQGLYISMLGIISGLILGILITLNLDPLISFIETLINRSLLDNYFINYFPYAFNFNQITLVLLSSFLLCFISSVWPSTRAAKLNPNEVLRHE